MRFAQRLGRLADLALAGQEDQHVAGAERAQLVARHRRSRRRQSRSSSRSASSARPGGNALDRIQRPDTSITGAPLKCFRKTLGIDRRRGDDHLQVRRFGSSCFR
jgi:hypothetical protein